MTRTSRQSEKKQLQGLNTRLAGLIDKVRMLESENVKMTRRRKVIEEHHREEVEKITTGYGKEAQHYKDAIDELTQKYQDLKMTADGLVKEKKTRIANERQITVLNRLQPYLAFQLFLPVVHRSAPDNHLDGLVLVRHVVSSVTVSQ